MGLWSTFSRPKSDAFARSSVSSRNDILKLSYQLARFLPLRNACELLKQRRSQVFKRLKRIEELMERFLANEEECLKIVRKRWLEYEMDRAAAKIAEKTPWKCPHPGCPIEQPHAHTIVMTPSDTEEKL